ncbi:glucans biosynthesis glucosyltransferase MdoH [Horticoccus luteus]|uniref:Glucans biosynthesis glucosyltransferase H n=1 Tax=Horticoccus luteus TaxID=2862869 RepID=A0A8F9TR58_9BACT|nr:glucans biosynthesis glucosyltransferase MdoH [Horticoccus luteus]QYM77669.1 glucans biosynthesis glucosyltransferase MdoH [Horticoccus luteus]
MKDVNFAKMDARRLGRRRTLYFTSIFALTSVATWFMVDLLWRSGPVGFVEVLLALVFAVLFAQIATGFCTAMVGLYVVNRGGDTCRISQTISDDEAAPLAATAVIMPVYNEEVGRVFEGLRAIYRSVQATNRGEHFDFFILSDSTDPNQWIEEEVAWTELCREVGGFGRIFYRKRRVAINKKAGNVADFLRRWGRRYQYMIVLDADSVMTGDAIVRLTAMMQRNPRVGIIQTAPRLVAGETLYARMQSFANRVYSPLFLAGLNYWQQHEANYWGHNAIIRVQPFIEHCALPDLPGTEPFGGRILSHDFVEAALMRKAGWAVWLAHDLDGSFEEGPPTLIDSAKRDRRWCQGNLQHTWLLTARGFLPANRFHLLMGVLAYVSSPLWLLFLGLSTLRVLRPGNSAMLPLHGVPASLPLFIFTMVLLFLPKIAATITTMSDTALANAFGGRGRLLASALLETVTSVFLAPINMMFHTKFVLFTIFGQGVSWAKQRRRSESGGVDWREAIVTHGGQTLFGVVWGGSMLVLAPDVFVWLSPVIAGLVLSVPITLVLGSVNRGQQAARQGLFDTPEETQPPPVLVELQSGLARRAGRLAPLEPVRQDYGLMRAVLDPYVNAMHVSLLRPRRTVEESREWFAQLRQRLLVDGPARLSAREKMALLMDAESMVWLHAELWRRPGHSVAEWWRLGMRQHNVLVPELS